MSIFSMIFWKQDTDKQKVAAGSFRPIPTTGHEDQAAWESREQQKFRADISERDDEAKMDIATIRCAELEALNMRFGDLEDEDINVHQEILLKNIIDRATNGPRIDRGEASPHLRLGQDLMRPPRFWEMHDRKRFYYR